MVNRTLLGAVLIGCTACCISCGSGPKNNHGPIVLGDPTTIVTETDSSKLQDAVTDLKPEIPPAKDEPETPPAATAAAATETKPATAAAPVTATATPSLSNIAGLHADFKETSVVLPGVTVKQAGKPNLVNANGAVYSLLSGTINGNTLKVSGNVTKVSMRYQSVVMVKNDLGTLPLESLSTTTSWKQMAGGNGNYPIKGLEAQRLEYADADAGDIRNAVQRAAQRRRYSAKKVKEWVASVRNVRAANQKPLTVSLRSVMWKIDGKDAQGKLFSKQIRIDIPM